MVDTGAVLLLLPQDLVEVLGLQIVERTVVVLAGPIGCGILIGQVILERLDLICDPLKRTVTPRPESPYMPTLSYLNSRDVVIGQTI